MTFAPVNHILKYTLHQHNSAFIPVGGSDETGSNKVVKQSSPVESREDSLLG
ncbi:unnamed protein product [Protopolystoma xenopodis]|uniref:Uncharacterized protein n=1 Tax=Protopolystoma xenopodis TaxID=117903 RepID=A0A448X4T1_9PLAT|nr:unnamed protein product [Protopolystoma xenopodis]